MLKQSKILSILTILFFISSCGYSPLYRQTYYKNIQYEMALTKIAVVQGDTGKNGQILRNYLYSKINSYGSPVNPKYSLEIILYKPVIVEKAFKKDDTASLATIEQRATYILRDNETKDILLDSYVSANSSYNILPQVYATDISKDSVIDRNLQSISDNIATRIALFFKEGK